LSGQALAAKAHSHLQDRPRKAGGNAVAEAALDDIFIDDIAFPPPENIC
jgi:hypothetical protein